MQIVSRARFGLLLCVVFGCEDSKVAEPKEVQMRPSLEDSDAGRDASTSTESDAAPAPCDDDPATPGNDCSDAVACRDEASCGLDGQSCCVAGLNVAGVACVDGLVCTDSGRATCDGPEDCGGNACCVDINAGTASCGSDVACDSGFQLCHDDDDCGSDASCSQGKTFTWWGLCG